MNIQTLLTCYAKGNIKEYLHNLSPDILTDMKKKLEKQLELNKLSNGGIVGHNKMSIVKRLIELELQKRRS